MTFSEKVDVTVKAVMGIGLFGLYAYCVVTQTPPPATLDQLLVAVLGIYGITTAAAKIAQIREKNNG